MKVVAIIQSRMGSTRLPGKSMAEVCGKPLLAHVIARVGKARRVHTLMVATTEDREDSRIAEFCADQNTPCYRGSVNDVLDRYFQAALSQKADVIVRITGDCPLIDAQVVDATIDEFLKGDCDYAANVLPPTFPDGLDTEVFSMETLEKAWREAKLSSEREHVTPYIYKHPELFRLRNHANAQDLSHMRWTVDQAADLELIRIILDRPGGIDLSMQDIVELFKNDPQLAQVNAGIQRNEGYAKSIAEETK